MRSISFPPLLRSQQQLDLLLPAYSTHFPAAPSRQDVFGHVAYSCCEDAVHPILCPKANPPTRCQRHVAQDPASPRRIYPCPWSLSLPLNAVEIVAGSINQNHPKSISTQIEALILKTWSLFRISIFPPRPMLGAEASYTAVYSEPFCLSASRFGRSEASRMPTMPMHRPLLLPAVSYLEIQNRSAMNPGVEAWQHMSQPV